MVVSDRSNEDGGNPIEKGTTNHDVRHFQRDTFSHCHFPPVEVFQRFAHHLWDPSSHDHHLSVQSDESDEQRVKELMNVQIKVTGIFNLSIRSTRGMRAWAPGARI